jgi:hypothetical protein
MKLVYLKEKNDDNFLNFNNIITGQIVNFIKC